MSPSRLPLQLALALYAASAPAAPSSVAGNDPHHGFALDRKNSSPCLDRAFDGGLDEESFAGIRRTLEQAFGAPR